MLSENFSYGLQTTRAATNSRTHSEQSPRLQHQVRLKTLCFQCHAVTNTGFLSGPIYHAQRHPVTPSSLGFGSKNLITAFSDSTVEHLYPSSVSVRFNFVDLAVTVSIPPKMLPRKEGGGDERVLSVSFVVADKISYP